MYLFDNVGGVTIRTYHPSGYSNVTIVEIPFSEISRIDLAKCKDPYEEMKVFYNRQTIKPKVLINGGFFELGTGKTVMNIMDEGEVLSDEGDWLSGIGILGEKDLQISKMGSRTDWRDFITGYPVLVENGEPLAANVGTELKYSQSRSIIGFDETNFYVIAIEPPGMYFNTLQNYLAGLPIKNAINMDGGGSTQLLLDGECVTSSSINRPVDTVVAVYLNEDEVEDDDTIIYRVQLGAFSKKPYADAFAEEVRQLSDPINAGLKNAFVRQYDNLYRVQVGAYSKHENAQRVVEYLNSIGYDAFVRKDQV